MRNYIFWFGFTLILSGCGGGDSNLSAECDYYKKVSRQESFSGDKTQAIQELEQKQAACSSGGLDIGAALSGGAGLNNEAASKCIARNLQEFKKAHKCS